jgi:hypothetical protein
MYWFPLLILALVVVAFVIFKRLNQSSLSQNVDLPYVLGDKLFTSAERSFLGVLDQSVGSDFRVFGKVRVADVISVEKGKPKPVWQRAFNRISAKHFDFVLCSPTDLKPVCAVELNDKSHAQDGRKGRDQFLEDVCKKAGLPLVFFPAQHAYTIAEVCAAIASAMKAYEGASSVALPE